MAASIKNILIGIFVIMAFAIVVFMLLFLHPTVGDNAKTLTVRFTNIDKVNVGTRVTYAGHPMGEVTAIIELPDARTGRVAFNGQVYVYEVLLKVDSGVNVYNTDTISLRTSGLLGERNIDITPGALKKGQTLELVNNKILHAVPAGSVEDTLKQFDELSKSFKVVLSDVHKALDTLDNEKVIANLGLTAKNAAEITTSINQPEKIDRLITNLANLSDRFNESWNTVDKMLSSLQDSSTNIKETTDDIKVIVKNTREGQGTIGKLFMKDDLYLRLKSILSKGDTVFNDIKQYGILFQLDKKWQRINARRQQLLQKLSKPELFAQYFNDEVDQISTSLENVSMVLNETNDYPDSLMANPDFTQRFSDLLRRVGMMEESLNMYNEQIVDQSQ